MTASILSVLQLAVIAAGPTATPSAAEVETLIKRIDERMQYGWDYRARCIIDSKRRDGNDTAQQLTVFRRSADDRLMLLYTKPKTDAGKGFLRTKMNLWFYDTAVGKWERRTERVGLGGTDARRRDFDDWRLSTEYDTKYVGREKVGKLWTHHFALTAKPDIEVSFPNIELWVDVETDNVLKMESKAESGRLMLTNYYVGWRPLKGPKKAEAFWVPKQIRIFDEVEKGNTTTVIIEAVDFSALPRNQFSKAWLEAQSR